MAVLLLAYAVARFIQVPGLNISLNFAGVFIPLQIDIDTLIAVLVAGLTATGTDWLLQSHPDLGQQRRLGHWLLPAMTAWVLTLPLANLPLSPFWWLVFAGSAALILTVLIAEYISINHENRLYSGASLALSALAFGLFLILAISLRAIGMRLVLILPTIAAAAFLVSARIHLLRSQTRWAWAQSLAIALLCAQIGAALHYLPLSAISFGLALLGLLYGLTIYAAALNGGQTGREAANEPLVALGLFWGLALLVNLL